jgi:2,4-dienoyl-CoA reductase-like NADH-dependent reductase (Old Yellow Enzyme family)
MIFDEAVNAKEAGFDGVEIHAANGYLIDPFLKSGTNLRTDDYGGAASNRVHLLTETVESVLEVWDRRQVGVRISNEQSSRFVLPEIHASDGVELCAISIRRLDKARQARPTEVRASTLQPRFKKTPQTAILLLSNQQIR